MAMTRTRLSRAWSRSERIRFRRDCACRRGCWQRRHWHRRSAALGPAGGSRQLQSSNDGQADHHGPSHLLVHRARITGTNQHRAHEASRLDGAGRAGGRYAATSARPGSGVASARGHLRHRRWADLSAIPSHGDETGNHNDRSGAKRRRSLPDWDPLNWALVSAYGHPGPPPFTFQTWRRISAEGNSQNERSVLD